MRASIILILMLVLAIGVQAQTKPKVQWLGLFVGPAVVTPYKRNPFTRDNLSIEANAIWSVGKKSNMQFELIVPVNGGKPLYRVAWARRIF